MALLRGALRSGSLLGRPDFATSYGQQLRLFDTGSKQVGVVVLLVVALALPFTSPDDILALLAVGFVAAIGAIGLNIVTGYAGQVSLGHAFFLGVGAYTAAVISGDADEQLLGLGITSLPVWLLGAGVVAALAGLVVAPLAIRLRGLYLAVVTLGLVVFGEYVFTSWTALTGGVGVGRPAAVPELFGYRLDVDGVLTREQQLYLLMFVLLLVFALVARNLVRSKVGRAFAAVRDRDVAAAVMGVDVTRYKVIAFVVSSFYAGCAGALLYTATGFVEPGSFNLLLSVQYIAMILIGGVATISGSIAGALFIILLPRITSELPAFLPFISSDPNVFPNVFLIETVLYGLLIILFLIFEPRGLFGLWIRLRTYWKGWPFTY